MYDEYPMEEDWDYYYEDLPDFEDFDLEDWDYDYDYDYMPDDYYYDGYMGYDTYASYDYGGYMNDTQEEQGMMEQAQGWFEDTFNMDSANKMIAAFASLATISAIQM